jgi:hypothetical protein
MQILAMSPIHQNKESTIKKLNLKTCVARARLLVMSLIADTSTSKDANGPALPGDPMDRT